MFNWRPRKSTTRIILHDSHTPPDLPSATAWMRTKGREMGLLEIGYHYVIERDGTVVEVRPHHAIGSHTPGHNHDSLGVVLAGGWKCNPEDFSTDTIVSLGFLAASIQKTYGPIPLQGHTEVQRYRGRHRCPALDMDNLRMTLCLA